MTLRATTSDFFTHALLAGTRGIVAVSGGPDSIALAHVVVELLREGFFPGIVLAHVNHQLRGAESDTDEAFVIDLPRAWQCPELAVRTTRIDVAARARESGENLEKTGREIRYTWLTQLAREQGAAWVATGHSADDQAETVLHRLLRGTGLKGLTAIHPRRALVPGVDLVRPLLTLRRADILSYLQGAGQPFREDSSNKDVSFTRNRIRLHLLPLLTEHYQPGVVDILCRLAELAQAVHEEITARASEILRSVELPRAGSLLVFELARLRNVSSHMICEMFRLVWEREGWPRSGMDHRAWLRLVDLVRGDLEVHDFPGTIRARRRAGVLQVGARC